MKFGIWAVLLILAALLSLMAMLWHPCHSCVKSRKARIAAAATEYDEEMARYRAQSGWEAARTAAAGQREQNAHGRCALPQAQRRLGGPVDGDSPAAVVVDGGGEDGRRAQTGMRMGMGMPSASMVMATREVINRA